MKKLLVGLLLAMNCGCGAKSPIAIFYPKDDPGKVIEYAYADAVDACTIASISINAKERKKADESLSLALMGLQGGGLVTVVDVLAALSLVDSQLRAQLALAARRVDERIAVEFTDEQALAITANVVRGCREGLRRGAPKGTIE